jgi:hypothetical protein
MRIILFFVVGLLIATTYMWWKSNQTLSITLPNDEQRKEMAGISNTPNIPLTPIQN